MSSVHHPYIGLRATSQPYEFGPSVVPLTVPAVTGTIVQVDGADVVLLRDDGSHATRPLSKIVLADPAEALRRIAALREAP